MRVRVLILFLTLCTGFVQANQIDSLMSAGIQQFEEGAYSEALHSFQLSASNALSENKLPALCIAYNNIGNTYARLNDELNGLKYYRKALTLAETLKDYRRIANTTFNIGSLYSDHKKFDEAIPWYNEAYKLAEQIKDFRLAANCLNNSAVIYEQSDNLEKAVERYSQALSIYTSQSDTLNIAQTLTNIAIVSKKQGAFIQSISYYKEALFLARTINDRYTEAAILNNLANVYLETGNTSEALISIKNALKTATEIGAIEIVIETYDGLATIHEKLKNYPESLKYRKLYEQEKSKEYDRERLSQFAAFEAKFKSERKQTEILVLKQKQKIAGLLIDAQSAQIKARNYLLAGLVMLFLMTGLILYSANKRKKLKVEIERQKLIHESGEKERTRISKDIHDDFGAGLSRINMLSELIVVRATTHDEVAGHAKKISESARYLVDNMHSLIWMLKSENTTARDLLIRIREYSSDYIENFPITLHTTFPFELPGFYVKKDICHAAIMTIKEALTNIIKHAKANNISLQIDIENDFIVMIVKDDGIGFNLSHQSQGNGLLNMKSRVESVHGFISMTSILNTGTEIIAKFPLS